MKGKAYQGNLGSSVLICFSMASFPCLAFLLPFFSLVWADINPSQEADINPSQEADINPSQERFLNFSFVPPSPNLLAAVGACQGGRCFYLLLGPIFQDIRKELFTVEIGFVVVITRFMKSR